MRNSCRKENRRLKREERKRDILLLDEAIKRAKGEEVVNHFCGGGDQRAHYGLLINADEEFS